MKDLYFNDIPFYENFVYNLPEREEEKMSSMIVLYDLKEAYIASDKRSINSVTYEITNENKEKIVTGENLIVGIVGRTSYHANGKKTRD